MRPTLPVPVPQRRQAGPRPRSETRPDRHEPGTRMYASPPGGRVSFVSSTGTNCQMPFKQICSRRELMTSRGSCPHASFS